MIEIGEIFFLPAIFWLFLVTAGIIAGVVIKASLRDLALAFLLFTVFMLPQLAFRVNNGEEPGRLIGQYIYYGTFLGVAALTRRAIDVTNREG